MNRQTNLVSILGVLLLLVFVSGPVKAQVVTPMVCNQHERVIDFLQARLQEAILGGTPTDSIYGDYAPNDLLRDIAKFYGDDEEMDSRFDYLRDSDGNLILDANNNPQVYQWDEATGQQQLINDDANLSGDYALFDTNGNVDATEYARYQNDYIAFYGADSFSANAAELTDIFTGLTGALHRGILDFMQVDFSGASLPLGQDALRQLIYQVRAAKIEFCSDDVNREFEIYRLERVIGFFEVKLQEAILGGGSSEESSPANFIKAIAAIYEVDPDDIYGDYPGVVGEIQDKIESLFPGGTDLSTVLMEQNHIREMLYFARYLLSKFIAEHPPKLVYPDLTVNGNLTVKGETTTGKINATVIESSLIKSTGNAELGGLNVKGAIVGGLITTTGTVSAGKLNANVVESSVIKSTGVAELGGLNVNGAVSAKGIMWGPSAAFKYYVRSNNLYIDKTAKIADLTVDSLSVNENIGATRAEIEALGAKEAQIESLKSLNIKSRDLEVDDRIKSNETFTENLFVGTHDANNFDNTTTAIVAYEKVVAADVEKTPEMESLESQIKSNEDSAARYNNYAARYRGGRIYWIYKNIADGYTQKAQDLRAKLDVLIAEQPGTGTKKVARVGIGVNDPQQSLHLSGAMRLEPMKYAPDNAAFGDIYLNSSNALCIFMQDGWDVVAGDGVCD